MLIDPESGWKYGFPKPAPEELDDPDFDLHQWLWDNGYPRDKVPYYVRYIGEKHDANRLKST